VKSVAAALGACGGTYFLAQFARDPGKNLQNKLFERWGGMPSVTMLRHRDPRLNRITKARTHQQLCKLVPDTKALTKEQEEANPDDADMLYAAWSSHLRNSTRDQKRFPLVFDELVAYGYRRNLLGLKPLGITISAACFGVSSVVAAVQFSDTDRVGSHCFIAFTIALIFLLIWIFRITAKWVRLTADAYAERLIETTELLHSDLHKAKPSKAAGSKAPGSKAPKQAKT